MLKPITTRLPARARHRKTISLLVAFELITLTALLASLASIVPGEARAAGDRLPAAGMGPRDAYAACAHFIGGGATPGRDGSHAALPNIDAWQWMKLPDSRFRVLGYADARSPVGERHRTYYQCDLVQLNAGRWRLDSLAVSTSRPI
jgi:hypothetical protein